MNQVKKVSVAKPKRERSFWFIQGDIDYEGTHYISIHFTKKACLEKLAERVKVGYMHYRSFGPFPMSSLEGFNFLGDRWPARN